MVRYIFLYSVILTMRYVSLFVAIASCNNTIQANTPTKRQPITERVVSTIQCEGVSSGSYIRLNGVSLKYKAEITQNGNIKASAEVATRHNFLRNNKQEYYKDEAGSSLARVTVDADVYAPFDNGGKWVIMLDRQTNLMKARYIDRVTGVIHEVFNFTTANCSTVGG
jgi:hypothetical protein